MGEGERGRKRRQGRSEGGRKLRRKGWRDRNKTEGQGEGNRKGWGHTHNKTCGGICAVQMYL